MKLSAIAAGLLAASLVSLSAMSSSAFAAVLNPDGAAQSQNIAGFGPLDPTPPSGVTVDEIKEVLLHSAIYAGVPAANSAFRIVAQVLEEKS